MCCLGTPRPVRPMTPQGRVEHASPVANILHHASKCGAERLRVLERQVKLTFHKRWQRAKLVVIPPAAGLARVDRRSLEHSQPLIPSSPNTPHPRTAFRWNADGVSTFQNPYSFRRVLKNFALARPRPCDRMMYN